MHLCGRVGLFERRRRCHGVHGERADHRPACDGRRGLGLATGSIVHKHARGKCLGVETEGTDGRCHPKSVRDTRRACIRGIRSGDGMLSVVVQVRAPKAAVTTRSVFMALPLSCFSAWIMAAWRVELALRRVGRAQTVCGQQRTDEDRRRRDRRRWDVSGIRFGGALTYGIQFRRRHLRGSASWRIICGADKWRAFASRRSRRRSVCFWF